MPSSNSPSEASTDTDELCPVVRRAVEDALWNVVGNVVYGLFLALVGLVGLQLLLLGLFARSLTVPIPVVGGGGLLVAGAAVGLLRLAGVSPL